MIKIEDKVDVLPFTDRGNGSVSVFRSVALKNGEKPLKVITLKGLFQYHENDDQLKRHTLELRQLKLKNKEEYKQQRKLKLQPFVLGNWAGRGKLIEGVSLLVFDVDGGDENTYVFNLANVEKSHFVYRMEQSLGGGCRVYVWANFTKESREDVYFSIAKHLGAVFDLPLKKDANGQDTEHIDTSTKDETRMWFSAHTPPHLVYHNEESKVWKKPLKAGTQIKKKDNKGRKEYPAKFTVDERVKDVIQKINETGQDITRGVESWFVKILLPLANQYGEAGRSMAHDISRFHRDYQEQNTNAEYSRALAKNNGSVSIGSFLEHAKNEGIKYNARRIYMAREKAAQVLQTKSSKWKLTIVPAQELEEKEMPPPSSKDLAIIDGRYYCSNGRKGTEAVSNFTMIPLLLLKDNKNPKRVLKCINVFEETTVICCPVKALSSNNEFSAIVEGRGNFVPSWTSSQFSTIKEYLYQHEDKAEEITVLGDQVNTHYYAFSNGIFNGKAFYEANDYGIVNIDDQKYYLPAFSKVNEDAESEYKNERKFIFKQGNTSFSSWSSQLVDVFGANGSIGICYIVAAMFRDIVFNHIDNFPLLFLFGPKGTGKTTFRNALHRLFGNYGNNDAIGLGSASSAKGFARKLAQKRNAIEPFEEYKNKINPSLIEMLKNIYDGIGYERAQTSNDNRTHATLVNSSVILGGQEMPTKENALFSRVIMLVFDKTKFTEGQDLAFSNLKESIEKGLGNVLLEVIRHRDKVASKFAKEYAIIYGHLKKDPATNYMETRTLSNVAAILAPFKILSEFLDFPFTYKEVYQLMRERIKAQDRYMAKTNEVNQFWQVLNAIEGKKFNRGEQYQIKDNILYVDLDRMYEPYRESTFKQDINALDKATLKSYLAMQPYYLRLQKGGNRITLKTDGMRSKQVRCVTFQVKGMESLELDFLE